MNTYFQLEQFSIPFSIFLLFFRRKKKKIFHNTREDYSNRASSRSDLDCRIRGKQHSISGTIWRNLGAGHRIFRFDPVELVLWPQTQYRKSPKRGGGNLFCLRKRGNFSNSRGGGGRLPTFRQVKTNENTRSSCTGCSINQCRKSRWLPFCFISKIKFSFRLR